MTACTIILACSIALLILSIIFLLISIGKPDIDAYEDYRRWKRIERENLEFLIDHILRDPLRENKT